MKKLYAKVEFEIIEFLAKDILTFSDESEKFDGTNSDPYSERSIFNQGKSSS